MVHLIDENPVVIIGSTGQLGTALIKALKQNSIKFKTLSRPEIDFFRLEECYDAILEARPRLVINAAAWTAVDDAETHEEEAFQVNSIAPVRIAAACRDLDIPMLHISTDYVFDGENKTDYVEDDICCPLNVYGESKLAGETGVLATSPKSIVLRTSWVYSTHGKNFFNTMLRLGKTRTEINVVNDQTGSPTSAVDLAEAIIKIIMKISEGDWKEEYHSVFHLTNSGSTTWFGFANKIFALAEENKTHFNKNGKIVVNPITSEQYPTPAKRPRRTVLNNIKIKNIFDIEMQSWEKALYLVFQELNNCKDKR